MNSDAALARLKVRLRKKRIGSIGAFARSSQTTNATSSSAPAVEREHDLRAGPALVVAADEAPDDPEQAGAGEAEAAEVELAGGPCVSSSRSHASGASSEADRHVDPEDPVPGDPLHDGAADERAERDRKTADAAPGAERNPAPLGGDGRAEDG